VTGAEGLSDEALHGLVERLLLVPRSLTGPGVTTTLEALAEVAGGLDVVEVPTGEPVLDWVVPEEWTLRAARLTGPDGRVVADAAVHPLHVLGYSEAVDVELDLADLQPHLHSDPAAPRAIPYRTSYYSRRWGFCLPHAVREALPPGRYRAVIDADLRPGVMRYGELVLRGTSADEVVVTSHLCHPGMANDNLSGNVVAAALAGALRRRGPGRLTWRFLWAPGTVGEIAWLARNRAVVPRLVGGLVLAGVGDAAPLAWKRPRQAGGLVDRAVLHVLGRRGPAPELRPWSPWGYAERQFNALAFGVPVGRLSRSEHGTYPEYHTSADDASFVGGPQLREALDVLLEVASVLDMAGTYTNLRPEGEPRLGPRGLYPSVGGLAAQQAQLAMLWVLSESDGSTDLLAVAERSGLPLPALAEAAAALAATDLLASAGSGAAEGPPAGEEAGGG
jgi:aminopeptidase-like protein